MLDNLVFYYDPNSYEKVNNYLAETIHALKVHWELTQMKNQAWKKNYSVLVTDPITVFINNFVSYGEHASIRFFPLQFHWFQLVELSDVYEWNNLELGELEIAEQLLTFADVNIESFHFEITLCIGVSQTIFNLIVKPFQAIGWKILQLQPDTERILYRDKFSLWHLVHPKRKIFIKGYTTNSLKYPKAFENMTKVEFYLPTVNFTCWADLFYLLSIVQKIRKLVVKEALLTETKQIIFAKAVVNPLLHIYFNNSNALSLAWHFLQFSQDHIEPYPRTSATFDEVRQWLDETHDQLLQRIKQEGRND